MTAARKPESTTVGEDIPHRMANRRGPRYRVSGENPQQGSESYRFFREVTDGLSNRIPLPSLEGMRAGTVNNPVSLMRRFFVAMRSAGLPKERAQRVLVWLTHTVDGLWPLEQTPRSVLQQREMQYEAANDQAEKCLDLANTRETVRACLDTCNAEIAAQMLVAAKLQRELEEMEAL